jgi:hypothetical protein
MKLPKPDNQIKRVVFDLIRKIKGVTESDYPYHAFRHYITIINRSIRLRHIDKKFVNTFGRTSEYRIHFLINSDKKKAIKYYLSLFAQKG